MHLDEPPDNEQANSDAALRTIEGATALHEQIEQARQEFGDDAGTVIDHAHHGIGTVLEAFDADVAARVGVFGRIR